MNAIKTLSRDEMREIKAGRVEATLSGGGNCRTYWEGEGWSDTCYSLENAKSFYQFSEITGYCCSSCGEGNFSHADSC